MFQGPDPEPVNELSAEQRIVLVLLLSAGLISGTVFAGWVFALPALTGFGVSRYPMWPQAALGYGFLALGFAAIRSGYRAAPLLFIPPLLIAAIAFVEEVSGLSLGTDTLLFTARVREVAAQHPGRPVANSIIAFTFLTGALLLTRYRSRASAELANLLATASLCFALFSLAPMLSIAEGQDAIAQTLIAPLPAILANILLSSAFLAWRHEAGWTLLLARDRLRHPFVGLMLPLLIILPILPILPGFLLRRTPGATPVTSLGADLLAVLCNVLIVGLLVWLSVRRVSSQQIALQEISSALDLVPIALTRPNGVISHWSQGCEQLYGWSSSEAVGRKKHVLLHSREGRGGQIASILPVAMERELMETCRDGSERHVIERIQVVERAEREPLLVLKMLDISDRVRAETALRESEERFAIAAEAQQLGVSHWDIATGRLEWSPGSEQRLGLETGSLSTFEQWETLVEHDDVQGIMDTVARAAASRDEKVSFRYRFQQDRGVMRTVEGSGRCLYDEHGTITAVVAANVDVTERIEREAVIRAGEAQLRSVLEAAPSPMIVADESGTILEFSPSAERLWGYVAADVVGRPVSLLAPSEDQARIRAMMERKLPAEGGVASRAEVATALTRDGARRAIDVSIGRAQTPAGTLVTLFCRDISDRLATEQRLSELNTELAHISRQSAMSEVAADLAHELNQPLSATANFLAAARMLVDRGEDGPRVSDLLRMGEEQTLRSGEIIRRLRDFLAKREVEMRPESLEHTVKEAAELVLFGTGRLDIHLIYRLDPTADMIFADRIQVQQVIVNLIRNAVDVLRDRAVATPEIVIASRAAEDDMVEVSVSDNGPGLPEALGEELYARFATTKAGTAMGIGLSISRRIVEAHGGKLEAENRPNGGATFRFTLPALGEFEHDS